MGGKTSKSTQTVSIPPEVLARYNAVNARAEEVAGRPFQPYSYNPADFVAQLTPTQLAGIQNVNYAAGQAQPYFDEATGQLMGAQMAATPYYAAAEQDIGLGQYLGQRGTGMAENLMYQGLGAAYPLNYQALGTYQQGYGQGQQLLGTGIEQYYGAQAAADPYQRLAGYNIGAAQDIGGRLAAQSLAQQAATRAGVQPLQGRAEYDIGAAQDIGSQLAQQAYARGERAGAVADPFQYAAAGAFQQAYNQGQQFLGAGVDQFYNALAAAQPLQYEAAGGIRDALGIGRQLGAESYGTTQRAGESTMPINYQSLAGLQQALGAAQPYTQAATQRYTAGLQAADPLQQFALQTLSRAGGTGEAVSSEALTNIARANLAAAPLQQLAQGIYGQAYQAAQPYTQAALQQYYGGLGAAAPISQAALANLASGQQVGQDITGMALAQLGAGQAQAQPVQQAALRAVGSAPFAAGPLTQAATANIAAAQAGVTPYQELATQFGLAGARPVAPAELGAAEIAQYMSPYIQNVVAPTAALMNQQAQQAQASQLGNAIRSGAFGGDRAAIAAANLQQQQALAQSKAIGDIMQAGYGQALAAAQQQQQLGLTAEQANRAAQQAASGQLLGIGQAGFGQGITAAQQQAALAQQMYGQQLGAGQAQAALAQQLFGQGATAAQQQQAAAQALFGQSAQAAQQQAALAQQLFGQQAAAGQNIAGLGQQVFGQGLSAGQAQQALAQQLFGQGATTAQQQAAIAQALFGQGATQAQQQAALAQQMFGQQATTAQGLAALGQQVYGQGTGTAQAQAAIGQQMFGQQLAQAQQQAALSQMLYGQGLGASQAQAALAQQQFAQERGIGQDLLGAGQQAFQQGMGLGTAQQGLAQQLFGQNLQQAQQQQALSQLLYGQGTGAAQQRAALAAQQFGQGSQEAQLQAALSQQLFGQGTTAAQQQAALGQQLFGQGLGVGQALTGAGQQAFQQAQGLGGAQQAIAQQLYAQGLGASQQQAALGQQGLAQQLAAAQARQGLGQGLYGMGAGTAQQLAALGTGAQGAALQGAQAQLAAGQAQQQTAQAGLQALYNQFLQQQAYPFQVAQFLGNIAMGTGALSGSTTTTVQPGSIFSDIRTKENVREVGKTLDGQPIYSYNYKGDPKTQMGLIAQEVEERHPEAVSLAGGLKTVNYKKATRDAERRGEILDAEFSPISEGGSVTPSRAGLGFADGGVPGVANEAQKAEEEMRRRQQEQEARNEQRAAQVAIESAKRQAPTPAPQVDLKPDLSAKPDVSGSVPTKQNIPNQAPNITPLAPASGGGSSGDPAAQDAATIASLIATAVAVFSDRRMKEDVKHIGFTHDGQKIYSYRIKGEPHTQIGLMADEVQKHKPEAVGSMNGLKMVDYDRATEDAIRKSRGGYADGGSPYAGLVNPTDMAALLAAQAQMFGPLNQFGRQTSGIPGAPGYVPGATLPVSSLMTAGDLPTQRSTADDIQSALSIGEGIKKLREPTPTTTTPTPSTTETEVPGAVNGRTAEDFDENFEKNMYRGGMVYADGGQVIPYATPTALNIPVEMKTPELMKAGSLPKQRSTMDDIAQALGIAKDAQSLMPKAYGGAIGRHGYQAGGGDPTFFERMIPGLQTEQGVEANRRDVMRFLNERILQNPYLNPAAAQRYRDERLRNQPTATTPATATTTATAVPTATTTSTTSRRQERPFVDPASANKPLPSSTFANLPEVLEPGLGAVVQGPVVGAGPMVTTPPLGPTATPTGGLAPPAATTTSAAPTGLQPPAASAATTSATPKKPGFMDWLRKEENYIPLLRGAAAAAAAPTQYTLPALLVGAGAYGKAKGDIMQQMAEIEATKAGTKATEAGTRSTNVQIANMMRNGQIVSQGGREFVLFADGSRMLLGQYLALSPEQRANLPLLGQAQMPELISSAGVTPPAAAPVTPPAASTAPPATQPPTVAAPSATPATSATLAQSGETQFRQNAPAGERRWLGSVGEQQYKQDLARLQNMSTEDRRSLIAENAKYQGTIDAGAQAAVGMGQNLNQMASTLLKLPDGGLSASGALASYRLTAQRIANDIIGTIAGAVGANPADYRINEDDIAAGTAADKIGRFMAFAAANGADQNSLGGLETAKAMVPTTDVSKAEAIQLLAGMYIDKQRALDMQNYVREYVAQGINSGMPEAVLINNAMNAFRREPLYNDRAYNERKRAMAALMQRKNSAGVTMYEHMMKKGYPPEIIDQKAAEALYGRKDVPPIRGMANIILGI